MHRPRALASMPFRGLSRMTQPLGKFAIPVPLGHFFKLHEEIGHVLQILGLISLAHREPTCGPAAATAPRPFLTHRPTSQNYLLKIADHITHVTLGCNWCRIVPFDTSNLIHHVPAACAMSRRWTMGTNAWSF